MSKCEACNGEGGWHENYDMDYVSEWEECPYCKATGKQTFSQWFWTHAPIRFVEWYGDVRNKDEQ